MDLKDLRMYNYLKSNNSELAEQVKSIYNLTFETINNISRSFGNYTMHDMNHSLRVAAYIEQLAFGIGKSFDENIKKFNCLEISIMILSAIIHDIGMTIRNQDKELIKSGEISGMDENLSFLGVLKVSDNNEEEAIKEIVRKLHHNRVYIFLDEDLGNGETIRKKLSINSNISYAEDIAEICSLHGEDHSSLRNISTERAKGEYTFNPQYIAALLRIADLLDIDKQRTPMLWYNVMNIDGFSSEEWETNFIIENTIKLKEHIDDKMQIFFDGKSSNAKIHRKYLKYIDDLKTELENTEELLNTKTANEKYRFKVYPKIDDRVKTINFTYSDLRLNLDYSAITNLLMGRNIYGKNELGLRELIQNSIDACELMQETNKSMSAYLSHTPEIYILISKSNNYVKIKDLGIGMTMNVIKNHFLNVGKSYYKSNEFLYKNCDYKPIGKYGIGFLSCFLLSDNVTVKTKYYNQSDVNQIELEKNSEYVVTTSQQTPNFTGTEITLDYNRFFNVFNNISNLEKFLEEYFLTSIPIIIYDEDNDSKITINNKYKASAEKLCKEFSNEFLIIDCQKHSDVLEGEIIINKNEIEKNSVENLTDYPNYIFDKDSRTIKIINDTNILKGNYYHCVRYPNLSSSELKTIKGKGIKRIKSIIKYSQDNNCNINIFIEKQDIDDFFNNNFFAIIDDDNEKSTKSIFTNSGLQYINGLFDDFPFYDVFKNVYIDDSKIVYINNFSFDFQEYYYRPKKELFSKYYNKGILIKNNKFFCGATPYKFYHIYGYLNNIGIDNELDVSRNKLIHGVSAVQKEIYRIVLTALEEIETDIYTKRILNVFQNQLNNETDEK